MIIPDSVTSIPDKLFYEVRSLENIVLPNTITSIGEEAFYETGSTSIDLPDSIVSIGSQAFLWCEDLTDIKMPANLEQIGEYAFAFSSLKNVVFPEDVTKIPENIFDYVDTLETVVIPSTIESIESGAFSGLAENAENTTFIFKGTNPPQIDPDAFGNGGQATGLTVIYPEIAKEAYQSSGLGAYIPTEGSVDNAYELIVNGTAIVNKGKTTNVISSYKLPQNASLSVSSSDDSVVSVSNDGVVTGVKAGTATITVTISLAVNIIVSRNCSVTVKEKTNSNIDHYYPVYIPDTATR